ncbi:MAG: succinic semialdehyde dehydrogenase [Halobacteriaceae archaeon]
MKLPVDSGTLAKTVSTTASRDPLVVRTPADGSRLGSVPHCLPADVEAAVERARAAQADWSDTPVTERAARLRAVGRTVLNNRTALAQTICAETGKARRDAVEEVADVPLTAQYYAAEGPEMVRPKRRAGPLPLLSRTTERTVPLGVVGLITPWNYPLTLVVSDALPALLAGNAVVIKADERTPFTALYAARLLHDAGIPEPLFQVVTGPGSELGEPLISAVDGVGFTGSTAVGREVAALAGRELTPSSLELGGKNPLVVLPDTDPVTAAKGTVQGAFASAGQLCIAIERAYVHTAVADAYREALVEATKGLALGVDGGWGTDMGSLLSHAQLRKTERHVTDAVERGATVLTGGSHRPEIGPWVYEPTILTEIPSEASMTREETFGPVLALHEVDSVEAAITAANDSNYGLSASVWGADRDRARRVASQIDCGTVNINEAYTAAWSSIDAPMGGMKDSGLGRRHGSQGLSRWTEPQTIAAQRGLSLTPDWLPGELWITLVSSYLRGRIGLGELSAWFRDQLPRRKR